MSAAPRLAVLVSGGGRSLENLAAVIARGELEAELALVISDRVGTGALERCTRLGVPALVWRIFDEERLLKRDLPGYAEYTQKAPFRLIPGLF